VVREGFLTLLSTTLRDAERVRLIREEDFLLMFDDGGKVNCRIYLGDGDMLLHFVLALLPSEVDRRL